MILALQSKFLTLSGWGEGGVGVLDSLCFLYLLSQRSSHFAKPRHAALVRALRSMRGEPSRLRLRWTLFWMMLTSHERCPSS